MMTIIIIMKNKVFFFFLPHTVLCSRMPFQRDGIWNGICDGEFTDFEGRRQDCALRREMALCQ